ncbi:MAG TPA: LLM class F420-dependent oxidoreductase [Actinomycetota bacterium]|nr:LLM class F420-dependent oxidoreductase [Actinomycetota bacterium]
MIHPMRIGVMISNVLGPCRFSEAVDAMQTAAAAGVDTLWVPQNYGIESLTLIAAVGSAIPGVELGTAVAQTYARHPLLMASQALTAQTACGGRLTLGIGPSHQLATEGMMGIPYERPARHTREYVTVLRSVLDTGGVDFTGEVLYANSLIGAHPVDDAAPIPILVAALAPAMVRLTGELADGTVTWMANAGVLGDRIVPSINAAAAGAGRPVPRVVAGLPVCITNDPDGARQRAIESFGIYGTLPAYRRLLDEAGVKGPEDVVLIGDEDEIAAQVAALSDAGATDLLAAPFGTSTEQAETLARLGGLR